MQTEVQKIKDSSLKAWVHPLGGLRGRGGGGQMSKFNYFRKCYVAYQIKGNESCVNMIANILPIFPLPGPWGGSNSQNLTFFRSWSCYISN